MLAGRARGLRRKVTDAVRLIDSTSLRLAGAGAEWARFSADVCGANAHIVYDPDPVVLAFLNGNGASVVIALPAPGNDLVTEPGYELLLFLSRRSQPLGSSLMGSVVCMHTKLLG